MRMLTVVGLLAVITATTAACGDGTTASAPTDQSTTAATSTTAASATGTTGATTTSQAAPTPTAPQAAVPKQLQFTAKTVDGGSFDGATLAGKPAVLWFWAPWCPDCNREAPGLREVAQANGDVTFVGIAGLDQAPAMQQFVQKHSLGSFVHLVDADGALWQRFGVTHQPAYAFVSSSGQIQVEKHQLSKDEFAKRVGALS